MTRTCEGCHGQGSIGSTELYRGTRVAIFVPCTDCRGTGTVETCRVCLGTGLDDDFRYCECSFGATARVEDASMGYEEPAAAGILPIDGSMVLAPGFTSGAQFTAYVARAKAAGLRTRPTDRPGVVMVSSGSSPAVYAVTRTSCSCTAGQTHGYCYHRSLVIWMHDVEGVPVCTMPTIGVTDPSFPYGKDGDKATTVTRNGATPPMHTVGRKAVA
jgi:hypothetical protein